MDMNMKVQGSRSGVDFGVKKVNVYRRKVKLFLWDTAGAERFSKMSTIYYRGAVGFIIVYDCTRQYTIDNIRKWMSEIEKSKVPADTIIMLVRSKCDIQESEVSIEKGVALAEEYGMVHFETSAKTSYNVENVCLTLARHILNQRGTFPELISHCQLGNLAKVRELIEVKKVSPNQTDNRGWTTLDGACSNGHLDVVKYVIKKCDPSVLQIFATMSEDQPTLHSCTTSQHLSVVTFLIENNFIDPKCTDTDGRTILHISAKYGYWKFVEFIVENEYIDPNCVDLRSWTPLFYAIKENHTSIMKYLLKRGADPKHKDTKAQNSMLLASSEGHFNISKYLIEKHQLDPNCKDNDGNTPLLWACRSYSGFDFAEFIIDEHSINPNSRDGEGRTPLMLACMKGAFDFAKRLIEKHNIDLSISDDGGRTALHWACTQERFKMEPFCKYLIEEHHVDYQCKDKEGWTPLLLACSCFLFKTAMYLLSGNYADPNERDKNGLTSLHWGCRFRNMTFIKYLMEEFPNINPHIQDNDGRTPLHHACRCGNVDIAKYMIQERHIDPNIKDKNGWTPLHWACRDERIEVVEYLTKERVVNPDCTDDEGWTPLHYACKLVYHEKVVSALVKCANVNMFTPEGLTPLDLAKTKSIIHLLLAHGAKPNYQQAEKCIPIHLLRTTVGVAVKILIVGNQGVGKSTLSKSISFEGTGWARIMAYLFKVEGVESNTAGIIPSDVNSKIFGKVTIYDFAGHREYHAGHGAVLQTFLSGSPSVVLLLVDMSESEYFKENLQYWLEFINIHSQEATKPHVIIVGSHVDKCENKSEIKEKTELIKTTANSLNLDDFILKGIITLNCQFAESTSMTKLRSLISDSCESLRSLEQIAFSDHFLLIFILDKFTNYPAVTVAVVEEKLHQSSKDEVHWSFMKFHNLIEICQRLDQHGNILFIKNEESPKDSWIITDKSILLSQVNGVLFAPKGIKHHRDLGSSTGIVSQSTLTSLFPNLENNLVICFLCHLEFCHELTDPSLIFSLQEDSIPLSCDRFFFFPGLVNCDAPIAALQPDAHFRYHAGWILQCMIPEQYFTPRFNELLLLRLAFKFVFSSHNKLCLLTSADPALRIKCRIWQNGLSWLDRSDAKAVIEIQQNKQVVLQVHAAEKVDLVRLQSSIIHEVVKIKENLCHKVLVNELIVFPGDVKSYPLDLTTVTVVAVDEVAHVIKQGKDHAIVNADRSVKLDDLLHFEPYAYLGKSIIHELFCDSDPKYLQEIEQSLLCEIAAKVFKQLHEFTVILDTSPLQLVSIDKHMSPVEQMLQVLQLWMKNQRNKTQRSRWSLGALLDRFSVFAGRNPLSIAMSGPLSLGSPLRSLPKTLPGDSENCSKGEISTLPTMADSETPEYKTLLTCTPKLRLAVRNNLMELSGWLLAKNLISQEHDSELRNEMVTADKRAARLVELIQWKVKQNPDNYRTIISVLAEEEQTYKEVLADIRQRYDSLSNSER